MDNKIKLNKVLKIILKDDMVIGKVVENNQNNIKVIKIDIINSELEIKDININKDDIIEIKEYIYELNQ